MREDACELLRLPAPVRERMLALEALAEGDALREPSARLNQITRLTGQFLSLLAAVAPRGTFVEIGTSAGYSALWIALACKERNETLVSFEVDPDKCAAAEETIRLASMMETVTVVNASAPDCLRELDHVAFCLLDAEKAAYLACYEGIVPKLVPNGLLVADNAVSHETVLLPFLRRVENDVRVDSLIVPIGKGELVCRRRPIA